ncbi:MAG: RAQPRD family integrative conjugative element protein [Gammaproteobacteria bacterium]|nr:RAQPRD family integrative conjugative element protein [Gammaproteobacteria bacterium]
MMSIKTYIPLALVIAVFGFTASTDSDSDAERAALIQLVDEINGLSKLIDRAEQAANPTARIQFQYDWLRRDLKLVRQGIEAHFETPSSEPREFEPLHGDYRQ